MDYSLYGYLSRRSKKELEMIVALYQPLQNDDFYKSILDLAAYSLEKHCQNHT